MLIRSLLSNLKRRACDEQSEERTGGAGLHLRLQQWRRLPLQSVHLQELQLPVTHKDAPSAQRRGCPPAKSCRLKVAPIIVVSSVAIVTAPAAAQQMDMPGMNMPAPTAPSPPHSDAGKHSKPQSPLPVPARRHSDGGMQMKHGAWHDYDRRARPLSDAARVLRHRVAAGHVAACLSRPRVS
jgi:hypothetical protein